MIRIVVTFAVIAVLLPVLSFLPAFQLGAFCAPAAYLSSVFLGVQCVQDATGYVLVHPALPILVTTACSASSFFVLVLALALGTLSGWEKFRLYHALLAIPVCYAVTIVANTGRIITGWYAGILCRPYVPITLRGAVHTSVGVLVFLTFLVLSHALLIRGIDNGRRDEERTTTA